MKEGIGIRGFAKVELVDAKTKKVKFKTGFENVFTNGARNSILTAIGNGSGTCWNPASVAVGTGGAPDATSTTLAGQTTAIATGTTETSQSTRLRVTASFATNQANTDISNMGLHHTASNDLICGAAFGASFAKDTSQELNVTYDITW